MRRELVELNYGNVTCQVKVPWEQVSAVLLPAVPDLPSSDGEEVERALLNPVDSVHLADLVRPGMRTAIMVSDVTRPVPTAALLPPLLSLLASHGVGEKDIVLVFGMGIHRPMSSDERRRLLGDAIYSKYRCVESTETGRFVHLGETSRGTPIEVCPDVAACDLLICTGNIEHHYFAGCTGGVKAVVPGACSRRTIEANHSMQMLPGAEAGVHSGNPVREDIEEAARVIGVDYILNVVLDGNKRIVRAVAGRPDAAHKVGRLMADKVYGVHLDGLFDIVLVSAGGHPKDSNLYQAQKALDNGVRALRPGGSIVFLARCGEGLGDSTFEEYMTSYDSDEIVEKIRAKFVLGGHKAAAMARILARGTVRLVSDMEPGLVKSCGMIPEASAQDAVDRALEEHGSRASVAIMPFGGATVPLTR